MNLVDSLNNNVIEPDIDVDTIPYLTANIENITTATIAGTLNMDLLSNSISVNSRISDEEINIIAERVYELIRQRGIEQ